MPPPLGEVAERSEVGGGVALIGRTLPQSAYADSPLSEGAKISRRFAAAGGSMPRPYSVFD